MGIRHVSWGLLAVMAGCGLNESEPFEVISLDEPPPPIVGGSLALTADGRLAVAGDADRDLVFALELESGVVTRRLALERGDEPGRLVEDFDGRMHVVLRGGGAVLSFDPRASDDAPQRVRVCDAPRGLDVDLEHVYVACASGEVLRAARAPALDFAPWQKLRAGLMDLVVSEGRVYVSHGRSASVFVLSSEGEIERELRAPSAGAGVVYAPTTAIRMRRGAGGVWLLHQRARVGLEPQPTTAYAGNFRGECGESSVATVIARVEPERIHLGAAVVDGQPSADFDTHDGRRFAVVSPSAIGGGRAQRTQRVQTLEQDRCWRPVGQRESDGQPVAVAVTRDGQVVTFSREPAAFEIDGREVRLDEPSRRDTGHDLFHVARSGVSCASCHFDGAEDGHTWSFVGPARRTRALRGGFAEGTRFHADGDVPSLHEVLRRQFPTEAEIYLDDERVDAVAGWLSALPVRRTSGELDVAHGAEIFERLACGSCHEGAAGSNGQLVTLGDVRRTVPRLVELEDRDPFLADGRASTLDDVFDVAVDDEHGRVRELARRDREALLAFLRAR